MDTSSATNMRSFFNYCEKLESIDISSFNTSLVTTMFHMFFHCSSLKLIVFPKIFDISNVITMNAMFSYCISLTAMNLSIFHLSGDVDIAFMFHNCNKLKYIDLSNTSSINITNMSHTFRNLSSLVYLNIPNLEINSNSNMSKTFEKLPSHLQVCANQPNMIQNISASNLTNNCSDICFNKNIKISNDSNECITSCKEKGYDYEYLNICFHQCPDYTHAIKQNNNNDALICLDKNPEGYYLDIDGFYKKCPYYYYYNEDNK
jgi:surface protein